MPLFRRETTGSEIRPLTALRMIAAALVFFHHYNTITPENASNLGSRLITEGHIGVNLFFVLSGFLIALRYLPSIQAQSFSYREYLVKRIARIWPLYFVILIPTLVLNPSPTPLINLTFTQGYFQGVFTGIPTAWSLSVEETFYLIAPPLFYFILRDHPSFRVIAQRLLLISALLFAAGIALLYLPIAKQPPYGFIPDLEHMAWYTLFGRMFDFAAGIFAAVIMLRLGKPQVRLATLLFWGSAFSIVLLEIAMNLINNYSVSWICNFPLAVCAATLIWSLTASGTLISKILSHPLPVYGGRISYALYLFHLTPMVVVFLHFIEVSFHISISNPLILYVALSLVSIVLYELIERPIQRLIVKGFHTVRLQTAV